MSDPVDKLRKLMSLAEGAGTPEEAEVALAQARKLAAKYHLELRAASDYEAEDQLIIRESDIELGSIRIRRYMWSLAWVVANAHGCVPWISERYKIPINSENVDIDKVIQRAWHGESKDGKVSVERLDDGPWLIIGSVFSPSLSDLSIKEASYSGGASPRGYEYEKDLNSLSVYRLKYNIKRERLLVMVGRSQIAEAAIYVYRCLLGSVEAIAKRVGKGGKTAKNSARLGVVAGLRARMDKESHEALQASEDVDSEEEITTSMVLAEACDDSRRFLEDAYGSKPFSKAKKSEIAIDFDSYQAGLDAAYDIDIPDPDGRRSAIGAGRILTSGKNK